MGKRKFTKIEVEVIDFTQDSIIVCSNVPESKGINKLNDQLTSFTGGDGSSF